MIKITLILLVALIISSPCFSQKRDTVTVIICYIDTSLYFGGPIKWTRVLEVREKHNTSEGVIDPGFYGAGHFQDYYKHIAYLHRLDTAILDKKWLIFKPQDND